MFRFLWQKSRKIIVIIILSSFGFFKKENFPIKKNIFYIFLWPQHEHYGLLVGRTSPRSPLTSVWLLEPSSFSLFICTHVCCHQLVSAVSSNPKQQLFVLFAEPGHVRRTVERFHRKSNNRRNRRKNSRYQSAPCGRSEPTKTTQRSLHPACKPYSFSVTLHAHGLQGAVVSAAAVSHCLSGRNCSSSHYISHLPPGSLTSSVTPQLLQGLETFINEVRW